MQVWRCNLSQFSVSVGSCFADNEAFVLCSTTHSLMQCNLGIHHVDAVTGTEKLIIMKTR